jgi:prepilin-type N-terminal cleavage/methylation domain-containing protein
MAKRSPPPAKRAFTLIELIVVIAIIFILGAIVVPAIKSALESAKATKDLSNLRQIGALMQSYLNDKDQILPATATWPGTNGTPVLYPKYLGTRRVFQSPFDKRPSSEDDSAPVSYSINHNLYDPTVGVSGNILKVVSPASTFFMAPTYTGNALLLDWHCCQRTRFTSRRCWGNNGNSSQWHEDQCPLLRLAHRNPNIRSG